MSTELNDKINDQVERFFLNPLRAYAGLGLDHLGKLAEVQIDAAKAYSEMSLQQARAALEIKAPQDFQSYVKGQQEVARTLSERVRGDTEKVVALNREFAEKAQKLAQQNATSFGKAAQQ